MRISDWSSDVCSSDLSILGRSSLIGVAMRPLLPALLCLGLLGCSREPAPPATEPGTTAPASAPGQDFAYAQLRSEEHTSELQSLMRISYAVFRLKKKHTHKHLTYSDTNTIHSQS